MGPYFRRYESLSHLLDAWLNASRAGDKALVASIEAASVLPYKRSVGGAASMAPYVDSDSGITVLTVAVKAKPVPIRVTEMAPTSIVPPAVQAPTAVLVGDESGGGFKIPWTAGPGALANLEWPLGSILFYMGARLAVSIGIYDRGESLHNLLVSKYLPKARLRVHTGVSRGSDAGQQRRDDPPPGELGPMVPFGAPKPPDSYGDRGLIESLFDSADDMREPYVRRAPELSPMDKFKANALDFFEFFVPNDMNPYSWFQ